MSYESRRGGIPVSGNYYYFFFAGYYATERAADVLQQYGIPARVVKSPVILQSGCSFAVLLDPADGESAAKVLAQKGLPIVHSMVKQYR
ncbi:MAG: hypothetical protein DBY07_00175 [Clostridiales bacterium]|nr:MAG: hypothetical protein DBY07_00175 [Clostridiales bacterium]